MVRRYITIHDISIRFNFVSIHWYRLKMMQYTIYRYIVAFLVPTSWFLYTKYYVLIDLVYTVWLKSKGFHDGLGFKPIFDMLFTITFSLSLSKVLVTTFEYGINIPITNILVTEISILISKHQCINIFGAPLVVPGSF